MSSGLDPNSMQVLATTSTQKLLWDFGNTECFYVLTLGPPKILEEASPKTASNFYGNAGVTSVYSPFLYNPYQGTLSDLPTN